MGNVGDKILAQIFKLVDPGQVVDDDQAAHAVVLAVKQGNRMDAKMYFRAVFQQGQFFFFSLFSGKNLVKKALQHLVAEDAFKRFPLTPFPSI